MFYSGSWVFDEPFAFQPRLWRRVSCYSPAHHYWLPFIFCITFTVSSKINGNVAYLYHQDLLLFHFNVSCSHLSASCTFSHLFFANCWMFSGFYSSVADFSSYKRIFNRIEIRTHCWTCLKQSVFSFSTIPACFWMCVLGLCLAGGSMIFNSNQNLLIILCFHDSCDTVEASSYQMQQSIMDPPPCLTVGRVFFSL